MFTTVGPVLPPGFRLPQERWLKRINLVVCAGLVVCLVVTLTDVTTRADRTMDDFWVSDGPPNLEPRLEEMLNECPMTGTMNIGDYDVTDYMVDNQTRVPLMAHSAGLIRKAIIISCVAVFLSVVNKTAFNYNKHEVAFYSLVFSKSYLLLLELIAIVWALVELDHAEELASFLSSYIGGCASMKGRTAPKHLFSAPHFIPLFVGFGVTLFVYVVNFLLLLNNSYKGVPAPIMDEWDAIRDLLRVCERHSGVQQQLDMSMKMEVDGYENQPGIKHLLAQELGLLPEDLERLAVEQAAGARTPPASTADPAATNPGFPMDRQPSFEMDHGAEEPRPSALYH
eukprot:TRINITY_DN21115_c0_g1_i1.p1 TRINITY_DN21115_c0_g1~~TRINITY_DN21115_c0_g1_i1.p1  ORF type:complete len:340 (+),score=136.61 TRINITY_DN21115_c0_g1_i1:50-1069(+)